jgi:hypothetical protein
MARDTALAKARMEQSVILSKLLMVRRTLMSWDYSEIFDRR